MTDRQRLIQRIENLPTVQSTDHWVLPTEIAENDLTGITFTTQHYTVFTTLDEPLILMQAPVFLESAFRSYTALLDDPVLPPEKFLVYLFLDRQQWANFTRFWAGPAAPILLKIQSGAYYFKGACVAWHLGRSSDFSVLAHEGWHQFSHQLFKYRLPAWLDEGIATQFETYHKKNGWIVFSPRLNGSRLAGLKLTQENDAMLRLSNLIRVDAGHVISQATDKPKGNLDDPKVLAYYAQLYGFVRYLREGNFGAHRDTFRRMLNDARQGRRWPLSPEQKTIAINKKSNPSRRWNQQVGELVFRSYIAPHADEVESPYQAFCRKITRYIKLRPR